MTTPSTQVDYRTPTTPNHPPTRRPITRLSLAAFACPALWLLLVASILSLGSMKPHPPDYVVLPLAWATAASCALGVLLPIAAFARIAQSRHTRSGYLLAILALILNLPIALLTLAFYVYASAWSGVKG